MPPMNGTWLQWPWYQTMSPSTASAMPAAAPTMTPTMRPPAHSTVISPSSEDGGDEGISTCGCSGLDGGEVYSVVVEPSDATVGPPWCQSCFPLGLADSRRAPRRRLDGRT